VGHKHDSNESVRFQVDIAAHRDTQDYWQKADMLGKLGRRLGTLYVDLGKDPQSCGLHCCGSSLVSVDWDDLRILMREAML
jgi:hypothetical protein